MSPIKIAAIIVFFIYSRPFLFLRYKFRSLVYKEKSWVINIKPVFLKETRALFSNKVFRTKQEKDLAKKYRLYLVGYLFLLALIAIVE